MGSKSLLRSWTNRDICKVYISSDFNIFGFEQWASMATIQYFIECANGSLLQSDYFLIVIEFPHTCIPYVRWLCASAKYIHLSAYLERKSLALFIAKIALYIFELILTDVTFPGQVGV